MIQNYPDVSKKPVYLTPRQFARLASKAVDILQRDGLCKDGTFGTDAGPKCAIGALRFAHSGSVDKHLPLPEDYLQGLFEAARPRTRRENIVDFNDSRRTRKHDVVELLLDMAVKATK